MTDYTYNMSVYLGKDWQNATQMMTVTHEKLKNLTTRVKGVGHKLYMDNSSSSLDLSDDLHTRTINCCGTVRQNCRGMPGDNKKLEFKWDDIHVGSEVS
jgi:hypothetical protein